MNPHDRGPRTARRALPPSSSSRAVLLAAAATALGAVSAAPSRAEARAVQDERYGAELTWYAALRLLRVDMGFTITERDRDAGFILFTYQDAGRATPGSLEIVPARVEGVAGCRVIVQISQMPTYAERHILTRLERKLRAEYGEPPTAPQSPSSPAPGQGGNGRDPAGGAQPGSGAGAAPARPGEPQPPSSSAPRPPDGRG